MLLGSNNTSMCWMGWGVLGHGLMVLPGDVLLLGLGDWGIWVEMGTGVVMVAEETIVGLISPLQRPECWRPSAMVGPPSRSSVRLHCLHSTQRARLSPSALLCLRPGLCWTSYWYSDNISSQRATGSWGSERRHSQRIDAWSVRRRNFLP